MKTQKLLTRRSYGKSRVREIYFNVYRAKLSPETPRLETILSNIRHAVALMFMLSRSHDSPIRESYALARVARSCPCALH